VVSFPASVSRPFSFSEKGYHRLFNSAIYTPFECSSEHSLKTTNPAEHRNPVLASHMYRQHHRFSSLFQIEALM
jgi:hypothetical protein